MDAWVWILIAIGILVVTWLVWMVVQRKRTGSLKERFGPEYDRTVRVLDDRIPDLGAVDLSGVCPAFGHAGASPRDHAANRDRLASGDGRSCDAVHCVFRRAEPVEYVGRCAERQRRELSPVEPFSLRRCTLYAAWSAGKVTELLTCP